MSSALSARRAPVLALVLSLAVLGASPSGAPAPPRVTRAAYALSERLSHLARLVALLPNTFVVVHWLGGRDAFWYERGTAADHEYRIVDAATGMQRLAFDHALLASALTRASGSRVGAAAIMLDSLEVTRAGYTATATIGEKTYRCAKAANVTCAALPAPRFGNGDGLLVAPNGTEAVFVRAGNLWLKDLKTGAQSALTTDGESADFGYGVYLDGIGTIPRGEAEARGYRFPPSATTWSPDSKTVIVPLIDQRRVAEYPFIQDAPPDGSFRPRVYEERLALLGEPPATTTWYAIDIASATAHKVELPAGAGFSGFGPQWWSADGTHLYAIAEGDELATAYFLDVTVATGAVRVVIREHLVPRADLNSTYYQAPNVWMTANRKDVIWFSQRTGWGHLYLYDVATGALVRQLTHGAWLVRNIVDVDDAHRRIYFTGSGREGGNPYYRYLYRVNFDGSGLRLLSPEDADHIVAGLGQGLIPTDEAVAYPLVSPSGNYVVYNYSTVDQPTRTVIRTTSSGRLVAVVARSNAAALYATGYRPPIPFTVRASDGTPLWGVLYRPLPFMNGKRYPLVDDEYTSPLVASMPTTFAQAVEGPWNIVSAPSLAALGFVVMSVNARGTPNRSKAFLDASYGRMGLFGLDDHVAAARQLARRFPYIDLSRMGIVGGSFGGESSIRAMLEFPNFFKVGVAAYPPGGLHNMYQGVEPWQGTPLYPGGGSLRPQPNVVALNYRSLDSNLDASRLRGKLFIIMGELDENAIPGSTVQFVNALINAGKDFDFIYVPNSGHFTIDQDYLARRSRDYFIRYLLNEAPPDDP